MIDKKTVKKVAEISRLKLTEGEISRFSEDLISILDAFKILNMADTKNVKPTFQPIDTKNVTREDRVEPGLSHEEAMANTRSNKEEGHFRGPKVV